MTKTQMTISTTLHCLTGFASAIPAGFAAAWPVNWWPLKRGIKKPCH